MTDWLSIALLIISVFLLILSIFLFLYYGNSAIITLFFMIGLLFGIITCIIFIYKRSPSTYKMVGCEY